MCVSFKARAWVRSPKDRGLIEKKKARDQVLGHFSAQKLGNEEESAKKLLKPGGRRNI